MNFFEIGSKRWCHPLTPACRPGFIQQRSAVRHPHAAGVGQGLEHDLASVLHGLRLLHQAHLAEPAPCTPNTPGFFFAN